MAILSVTTGPTENEEEGALHTKKLTHSHHIHTIHMTRLRSLNLKSTGFGVD